jgi:enoyl-[acyl-carrier protein] reductase I
MTDIPIGLVIGVANEESIAWACAKAFHESGAQLIITYQNEDIRRTVESLGRQIGVTHFYPLDVTDTEQVETLFTAVRQEFGHLDFLLHSIAFAPLTDLLNDLTHSSASGFGTAMDISCHSLVRLANHARTLMIKGGSILTLSYYGAEKVMPHYSIMGPVKAALESVVRYLAWELGPFDMRINALSPGPVRTRVPPAGNRFDEMMEEDLSRIPLRRAILLREIGDVAAFLVSPQASGINGQVIHVDNGYTVTG